MVVNKIMVCGGRDFEDIDTLYLVLDELVYALCPDAEAHYTVISGGARGADALAALYAKHRGLELDEHPAEWDIYGKSAGYRRNAEMVELADAVIAFWDGKSKGTKHSIDLALAKGKHLMVVHYD